MDIDLVVGQLAGVTANPEARPGERKGWRNRVAAGLAGSVGSVGSVDRKGCDITCVGHRFSSANFAHLGGIVAQLGIGAEPAAVGSACQVVAHEYRDCFVHIEDMTDYNCAALLGSFRCPVCVY